MYNLFVTFTKNQWEKGAYAFRPDRVIKIGTDNDLKDRFASLDESACVFRLMPGHSSGPCRAAIPEHAGPGFRSMPGQHSGACRAS